MFVRNLLVIAALLVPACLAAETPKPLSSPSTWTLSPNGLGPLRIGMTYRDAGHALGTEIRTWKQDPSGNGTFECDQPAFDGYAGLSLLFESGRLNSIDVWKQLPTNDPALNKRMATWVDMSGVSMSNGLRIGSSEVDLQRIFGARRHVEVRPYYDEPAHQVSVWNQAARRGVVFDTNENGTVERISVGGRSIRYMEGCL
jgi:hypothetical protein